MNSPRSLDDSAPVGGNSADDVLQWREAWDVLWGERWFIARATAYGTILAAAISLLMTPVYRVEAVLDPVAQSQLGGIASSLAGKFGDLAGLAGVNPASGEQTQGSIAMLRSRALAEAFIRERGLMPVLFSRDWDEQKKEWSDPADPPTMGDAYEKFDEQIREVKEDRKSGMVKLIIEWEDPRLAAQWANELVKRVNKKRQIEAIRMAESSIRLLNDELRRATTVEMQQAIYRLIESQTKSVVMAKSTEEYAFTTIDPAVPPDRKIRPKRWLIAAFGMFVGFVVAALIVLMRRAGKERRPIGSAHRSFPPALK